MDAESLRGLAAGRTVDEIASLLGVHPTTARRWLIKHGIETARMRARRENATARAQGMAAPLRICPIHGEQRFRATGPGFRCPRCNAERVMGHRRAVKAILVAEAGGACQVCGYDRCLRALEFHHRDRAEKEFGIGRHGHTRSLARARAEVAKCVLLCSNCHMEIEDGLTSLD
jgi:excisionase family DNA binding protein